MIEASQTNQPAAVALLLSSGAHVNQACSDGATALFHCIAHGWQTLQDGGSLSSCKETIKLLLFNQADPNQCTDPLNAPLHEAIECDDFDLVRLLIANNASPRIRSQNGELISENCANRLGADHIITQYLQASQHWNPLMRAVAERQHACVQVLLPNAVSPERALNLARNEPVFVWSKEVCPRILQVVEKSLRWSPQSHGLFPKHFQRCAVHVLMLQLALDKELALPSLPKSVWFEIIGWLPRRLFAPRPEHPNLLHLLRVLDKRLAIPQLKALKQLMQIFRSSVRPLPVAYIPPLVLDSAAQ